MKKIIISTAIILLTGLLVSSENNIHKPELKYSKIFKPILSQNLVEISFAD